MRNLRPATGARVFLRPSRRERDSRRQASGLQPGHHGREEPLGEIRLSFGIATMPEADHVSYRLEVDIRRAAPGDVPVQLVAIVIFEAWVDRRAPGPPQNLAHLFD